MSSQNGHISQMNLLNHHSPVMYFRCIRHVSAVHLNKTRAYGNFSLLAIHAANRIRSIPNLRLCLPCYVIQSRRRCTTNTRSRYYANMQKTHIQNKIQHTKPYLRHLTECYNFNCFSRIKESNDLEFTFSTPQIHVKHKLKSAPSISQVFSKMLVIHWGGQPIKAQ